MNVDLGILFSAIGFLGLFLIFFAVSIARRYTVYSGMREWVIGFLLLFAGIILLSFRRVLPAPPDLAAASACMGTFMVFVSRGLKAFVGDRQRNWFDVVACLLLACFTAFFLGFGLDYGVLAMAVSLMIAVFTGRSYVVVLRGFPRPFSWQTTSLVATLGLCSSLFFLRACMNLAMAAGLVAPIGLALFESLTLFALVGACIILFSSLAFAYTERLERDLLAARGEVEVLSGLLPICSGCKRIRDHSGAWIQVEDYISSRSQLLFSHGLCPECLQRMYPDIAGEMRDEMKKG